MSGIDLCISAVYSWPRSTKSSRHGALISSPSGVQ